MTTGSSYQLGILIKLSGQGAAARGILLLQSRLQSLNRVTSLGAAASSSALGQTTSAASRTAARVSAITEQSQARVQQITRSGGARVNAIAEQSAARASAIQTTAGARSAAIAEQSGARRVAIEQRTAAQIEGIRNRGSVAGRGGGFNFSGALKNTGQGLQSAGAALTAGLSVPIVGGLIGIVQAAAKYDTLKRSLVAVTGSAAEAKRQFAALQEVARLPGIDLTGAVQSAIALQSLGFKFDKTREIIVQFSNALNSGIGGPEVLPRITLQLTQMANRSKVLAEDLKPIVAAAPAIGRAVKQAFGTVNTEELQKRGVKPAEFIDKLLVQLAKMERFSGGAANAFVNFKDSITTSAARVGEVLLPPITKALDRLEPLIGRIAGAFTSLAPATQLAVIGLSGLVALAGPLLLGVGGALTLISTIGLPVAAALTATGVASGALAAAWVTNFGGIREPTQTVFARIMPVIQNGVNGARDLVMRALPPVLNFVRQNAQILILWWQQNLPLIQRTVSTLLARVAAFWQAHGEQIVATVSGAFNLLSGVFQTGLRFVLGVARLGLQLINGEWEEAGRTVLGIVGNLMAGVGRAFLNAGPFLASVLRLVLSGLVSIFGTLAGDFYLKATTLGQSITDGIVAGIKSGTASVLSSVRSLATATIAGAAGTLMIHSPSRVFQGMGEQVAAGFSLGIHGGIGRAQKAASALALASVFTATPAIQAMPTATMATRAPMSLASPAANSPAIATVTALSPVTASSSGIQTGSPITFQTTINVGEGANVSRADIQTALDARDREFETRLTNLLERRRERA